MPTKKAVGSSVTVPVYQTSLRYIRRDIYLPHLIPQPAVIQVPDDSVRKQLRHGYSSSLGTVFCHCCLWTSTLLSMVVHLLLFTQQFELWAKQLIITYTLDRPQQSPPYYHYTAAPHTGDGAFTTGHVAQNSVVETLFVRCNETHPAKCIQKYVKNNST